MIHKTPTCIETNSNLDSGLQNTAHFEAIDSNTYNR
uniref:Uncharacterized protein n=1 Tax=Rhizophora mucronata TaxID=61149 RepID=A0A2P2QEU4_RHIMU